MVTRKQTEMGPPEIQHGTACPLSHRARGMEKLKDMSKPPKTPKGSGKDPPRDMLYYAQKLSCSAVQGSREDMLATPAVFQSQPEDEPFAQGPSALTGQTFPDMEGEEADQPTLAEILRAVHKCTALVHTLQEHFGVLKEELGFIRHDLQKTRERTSGRRPH